MRKKKFIILGILFIFSIVLSGCIDNNTKTETNNNRNISAPIAIIIAPQKAYFGEIITFDASSSYDINGKIVSYKWDFGDEQAIEGIKVTHIFQFENNFEIDYPLIYTVILRIKDNDNYLKIAEHQIMLSPNKYMFYLDTGKLIVNKPVPNEEKTQASGKFKLNSAQETIYNLESSIKLKKCEWNATIYLKKPILAKVDKIIITLYNKTGVELSEAETSFKRFEFWKDKEVLIKGEIAKTEDFKSVKISIYGISLGKKISILYGAEKASCIYFSFVT